MRGGIPKKKRRRVSASLQEISDVLSAPGQSGARVLGRVRGVTPGPTLLCIGALHGNEPAGVRGAERVLEGLAGRAHELRGDFVALLGNRSAFARGCRFVHRDLNRAWTDERLDRLRREGHLNGLVEDREQVELLDAIEEVVESARGPIYVIDLHTTSGAGGPFITFGDTLANRAFAGTIPVPMILGLEELLDGTLLAFLVRHGLVAVAYESGQHEEARAVDRAEAGIWIAAAAVGLLPEDRIPEADRGRAFLREDSGSLPRVTEMVYRHAIEPEDEFRMNPGYRNFQAVTAHQVVARDVRGAVRTHMQGRILMPLYQKQGEDGFFLIREFHPFWLAASSTLRRLRADVLARHLPGVSVDPDLPDTVIVNKRIARWFALQLFHLLGYRKHEDAGSRLVMRRRRYDDARYVRKGPEPEPLR